MKEDDDHETAGSLNGQEGAVDLKDASRRKKKKKKKKPSKVPSSNTRSSEDNIEVMLPFKSYGVCKGSFERCLYIKCAAIQYWKSVMYIPIDLCLIKYN